MTTKILSDALTGNLQPQPIDTEQVLADLLQDEIWKEIEKETGMTKAKLDAQIINKIREAAQVGKAK